MFRAAYDTALRIGNNYDIIQIQLLFFLGKTLAERLNKPVVRQFTVFTLNDNTFSYLADRILKLNILHKCKYLCRFITKKFFAPGIQIKENDFVREAIKNEPTHNIVYASREFQIFNDEFPEGQYTFVGPSISDRIDKQVIPFHKMDHPIIYISLGTIHNKNKRFYQKCMAAFSDSPVSLILFIGSKLRVEDFKPIPSNCFVYNYVPQLEVLKQADLFITHGGMNSINESIYYGVPMLVFPLATDQPANADRIEELGIGKQMKTSASASRIKLIALDILNNVQISKSNVGLNQNVIRVHIIK